MQTLSEYCAGYRAVKKMLGNLSKEERSRLLWGNTVGEIIKRTSSSSFVFIVRLHSSACFCTTWSGVIGTWSFWVSSNMKNRRKRKESNLTAPFWMVFKSEEARKREVHGLTPLSQLKGVLSSRFTARISLFCCAKKITYSQGILPIHWGVLVY